MLMFYAPFAVVLCSFLYYANIFLLLFLSFFNITRNFECMRFMIGEAEEFRSAKKEKKWNCAAIRTYGTFGIDQSRIQVSGFGARPGCDSLRKRPSLFLCAVAMLWVLTLLLGRGVPNVTFLYACMALVSTINQSIDL